MPRTQVLPLLVLSILFVYFFAVTPQLTSYSLQLFAIATLSFIFLRWKQNKKSPLSFTPSLAPYELIPLTIAILSLIATTGNTHSWVYALTYGYLFIIIFSLEITAAAVLAGCVLLLQLALVPTFTPQELIILLNIPIITGVLLFAKKQLTTNQKELVLITAEAEELRVSDQEVLTLEHYHTEFLIPKLEAMTTFGEPRTDLEKTLISQLELLVSESKKMLKEFEK